jgi:hypothetical protein
MKNIKIKKPPDTAPQLLDGALRLSAPPSAPPAARPHLLMRCALATPSPATVAAEYVSEHVSVYMVKQFLLCGSCA